MKRATIKQWRAKLGGGAIETLEAARPVREKVDLPGELLSQLRAVGLGPLFTREHRFHVKRKWRLDLYCAAFAVGVEAHGGIFTHGRHTRGSGFERDRQKMNAAAEAGITVLEYTPKEIRSGDALKQIERVLKARTNG